MNGGILDPLDGLAHATGDDDNRLYLIVLDGADHLLRDDAVALGRIVRGRRRVQDPLDGDGLLTKEDENHLGAHPANGVDARAESDELTLEACPEN